MQVQNKATLKFGHTWDLNPGLMQEDSMFDPSSHPDQLPTCTCTFILLLIFTLVEP